MNKIKLVLLICITITACVSGPTQEDLAKADYGPPPHDHETLIKNYMASILKDPTSATYQEIFRPRTMWAGGGLVGGPIQYGWGTCFFINAKNSFGGFVGAKKFFFLIRDNKILRMEHLDFVTESSCR